MNLRPVGTDLFPATGKHRDRIGLFHGATLSDLTVHGELIDAPAALVARLIICSLRAGCWIPQGMFLAASHKPPAHLRREINGTIANSK